MFDDYFEVFLADSVEGKDKHYHIRYQVYCEEMGFEKINNQNKCEKDRWDDHSVHFLVRLKGTDQWVGAMRLVLPNKQKLPMLEHCTIDEKIRASDFLNYAEVSRLCVVKEIRRRKTDGGPPLGIDEKTETDSNTISYLREQRTLNRSIIWGLIRAAALYSAQQGIDNWYFLTTAGLAKVLSKEGLKLYSIGPSCEHKGERFPFKLYNQETFSNPLWEHDFKMGYRLYSEIYEYEFKQCA